MIRKLALFWFTLLFVFISNTVQAEVRLRNFVLEYIEIEGVLKGNDAKLEISKNGLAWGIVYQHTLEKNNKKKDKYRVVVFRGKNKLYDVNLDMSDYDDVKGPYFSPNGKNWGLIYRKKDNNQCYIKINGKEYGPFMECQEPVFSVTGNYGFVAKEQNEQNEKEQGEWKVYIRTPRTLVCEKTTTKEGKTTTKKKTVIKFDGNHTPQIKFSPNGRKWAFSACSEPNRCYVSTGKQIYGPYHKIDKFEFFGKANQSKLAIEFQKDQTKYGVKVDNWEFPDKKKTVDNGEFPDKKKKVVLSYPIHNSSIWGYIYQKNSKYHVVRIDGKKKKEYNNFEGKVKLLTFSPEGKTWGYMYRNAKKLWKVKYFNGENPFNPPSCNDFGCDFSDVSDLAFTDSNARWGFVGKDVSTTNKSLFVVIYNYKGKQQYDHETYGPYHEIGGPFFGPDGKSWGFQFRHDGSYNGGGYHIYDNNVGKIGYESIVDGKSLVFSKSDKQMWGFVYRGRGESDFDEKEEQWYAIIKGKKIANSYQYLTDQGFADAILVDLESSDDSTKYSFGSLLAHEKYFQVRIDQIESPYSDLTTVSEKTPIETSHYQPRGYTHDITLEEDCDNEKCVQLSSKTSSVRLFFEELGLVSSSKISIKQCKQSVQYERESKTCGKNNSEWRELIGSSRFRKLVANTKKEESSGKGITRKNVWVEFKTWGGPIKISYELKAKQDRINDEFSYPYGYKITKIQYYTEEKK